MTKKKPLHFVAWPDVNWEATAKLPTRKDGRFPGVVEKRVRRTSETRKENA